MQNTVEEAQVGRFREIMLKIVTWRNIIYRVDSQRQSQDLWITMGDYASGKTHDNDDNNGAGVHCEHYSTASFQNTYEGIIK